MPEENGAAAPPPLAPFLVEPILSECRRDVVALAEWAGGGGGGSGGGAPMPSARSPSSAADAGPSGRRPTPRAYIGLDDGTLLVLRRDGEGSGGGGHGARPSSATATDTAEPRPPQPAASLLVDAAPPWRVVAAHTHIAQKAVRQMQVRHCWLGASCVAGLRESVLSLTHTSHPIPCPSISIRSHLAPPSSSS
jgi:hypothetical protein